MCVVWRQRYTNFLHCNMIDCPVDLETQYTALELIVTLNNEPQKIGDQESGRAAQATQQQLNEMGQAGRRTSPEKK